MLEFDVFSATSGQGHAVVAACPAWALGSTALKCEKLEQCS